MLDRVSPCLRSLDLRDVHGVASSDPDAATSADLYFDRYAEAVSRLPRDTPNLRALRLELADTEYDSDAPIPDRPLEHRGFAAAVADAVPRLALISTLTLPDCRLTATALSLILPVCGSLERLALNGNPIGATTPGQACASAVDQLADAFASGHLSGLVALDVDSCRIEHADLARLVAALLGPLRRRELALRRVALTVNPHFADPWDYQVDLLCALGLPRVSTLRRLALLAVAARCPWSRLDATRLVIYNDL